MSKEIETATPAQDALVSRLGDLCGNGASFIEVLDLAHRAFQEAALQTAVSIEHECRVRMMACEQMCEAMRQQPLGSSLLPPVPGPSAADLYVEIEREIEGLFPEDKERAERLIGSVTMFAARYQAQVQQAQDEVRTIDHVQAQRAAGGGDLRH